MMEENWPGSTIADALNTLAAPPQSEASWAYERGSAATKPSPYNVAPDLDGELAQQQSFTTTQQLPTYTTAHIPAAVCTLESSSNNPVTSIMSFLSAMESRSLQAGPVRASLVPPFRPPSCTTGANSSSRDLYLTGALPSTTSSPSPAVLSTFQHTSAYPSRSYATNTTLTLPDGAFSASTSGLFSHHDHLLHLKPSQALLPTALAFNHLSAPSVGSALPVDSSTYRSAQESAPHLLQPQFSLVPSALHTPHGAPQTYGAIQRECSVIKHHQRPCSSHTASEKIGNTEDSLQEYFVPGGEPNMSYPQDPSRRTPVSCSSSSKKESTQGVNRSPQPKSDIGTQPYSSTLLKSAEDSIQLNSHTAEDGESNTQKLTTDSSSTQKQNADVASQQASQISGLMSDSLSQTYVTPQTQSQTSHYPSDNLSSLYTTLASHSSHCDNMVPISQTLIHTTTPVLSQEQIQYGTHVQRLCQDNFSEIYPSAHSQGVLNVPFTSQNNEVSATHSQSFNTAQSLNSVFQSTCMQSLPTPNSMVEYKPLQGSVGGTAHTIVSHQQKQSHSVLSVPLPTYSSPAQPLQDNISTLQEAGPTYAKQDLPPHDSEALKQVSIGSGADNSMITHKIVIYVVSQMDDHKPQIVIRNNSQSDEQFLGVCHANQAQIKDGHVGSMTQQQVCLSSVNGDEVASSETSNTPVSSHGPISKEQLNQQLRTPEPHPQNQQSHTQPQSEIPPAHSSYMSFPSSQVFLESNQVIPVQQPLVHQSQNTSNLVLVQGVEPAQGLGSVHIQYHQVDRDLLCTNVTENLSQQTVVMSEPSSQCSSSTNLHYSQTANQRPNDGKSQFALDSICFPDSMLLADERNILSDVDDIFAATEAACGVTPQDFVKAASSSDIKLTAMSSPVDSKGHLMTVDISQMSPSFSSAQHPPVSNTHCHTISMTLNGAHMATASQDQSVGHNSYNNLTINGDGRISESSFQLARQVLNSLGVSNGVKDSTRYTGISNGGQDGTKYAETQKSLGTKDSPKKKTRSKSRTKPGGPEEGEGFTRPTMRGGQTKCQISRGSDASSPSAANGTRDSVPQRERIQHKIREVEEKQPEGVEAAQRLGPVHVQYHHTDRGLLCTGVTENQSQQTIVMSEPSSVCSSSTNLHYSQMASQQPNDVKMTAMSSPVDSNGQHAKDSVPQQERIWQKIREVEEKQPEVKTGFLGSFLDFIKSGPKQQYSPSNTRTSSRPRKPSSCSKPCILPSFQPQVLTLPRPSLPQESPGLNSQQKHLEKDLQKNLNDCNRRCSFSSDEEESTGRNQALRNSISSALSALDKSSDGRTNIDNQVQVPVMKPVKLTGLPPVSTPAPVGPVPVASAPTTVSGGKEFLTKETTVAIEGLTEGEPSDSEGEGMYRERDEFVIKNEDIETFKVTMRAGVEPPAIWKVQKALLQKFVPELKDGKRVFSATNSYLGYFGDAKTLYKRVYVKFLENFNKREYVRVCSRKPRRKPMSSLKAIQMKALLGLTNPSASQNQKPWPKVKSRADSPPKKRKKWKEDFLSTPSGSSAEEELNAPFTSRLLKLNMRTMKETFKSFVELLISVALDEDVMTALERANDELLLPHMKKVDGMISDIRKRLLNKLHIGEFLKTALDSFPEISVVTELKDGETSAVKVRLSGKAYDKNTMKPYETLDQVMREYSVDQQKIQWFSLYHSLEHYKYHTYLMCKDKVASLWLQDGNLGQEETIQKCLQNEAWVEGLFDHFEELISEVQQVCR
ncbi:glutamine and serine-rich protein 1 [Cyprinodon tularosa]|uniref:glutamine and serine-rich protein 1 n=1 Tax=Cyprinodon tularosa TaxID=77115 RepID=UPI0018E20116|nr:glutamine and serine-rich protein 1 [Cyprinodon tularosa]